MNKGSAAENEVRIVVLHACQDARCYRLYDNNVREGGHGDGVGSWPFRMGQIRTRARSRARYALALGGQARGESGYKRAA